MDLGGAILVSAAVATGPQQEIRAIPSEGIIRVAAVDDPVEVEISADPPEATTSTSMPPPLGAADISPTNDNTTIFVIVGGIGLVALVVIILGLVRRSPKR
jgi:hypothetical protein